MSTSLGATLIAALIVQAVPHATSVPAPAPELTPGGKFAARVASAQVYDGLDTMPLPRIDPPRAEPTPAVIPAAFLVTSPTDPAGFGALPLKLAPDGVVRGRAKPPRPRSSAGAEVRHPAAPAEASAAETAPRDGTPVETASASDGGFLGGVASKTRQVWTATSATTRAAWSMTTSAGSSLIARIAP